MTPRTALIIAAALTVFLLVLVGGVAMATAQKAAAMNVATPAPIDTSTATATATLTNTATPTDNPTNTPVSFLTADQAAQIAKKLPRAGSLRQDPQLVNYRGKMAYEVLLSNGAVYVDAFSSAVLYNGINVRPPMAPTVEPTATDTPLPTAPPPPPPPPPSSGGGTGGSTGGGTGGTHFRWPGGDDGGHERGDH